MLTKMAYYNGVIDTSSILAASVCVTTINVNPGKEVTTGVSGTSDKFAPGVNNNSGRFLNVIANIFTNFSRKNEMGQIYMGVRGR